MERVFRLESEKALQERMRNEAKNRPTPERIEFPPEEPALSTEPYAPRGFPPMTKLVEPHYVCYGRLLFEQKNFERYGWDLGPITPVVSAGKFFVDLAALPYHLGVDPCRRYDCSAGHCLPGDPVPLLLYPPQGCVSHAPVKSIGSGALLEAGAVVALFVIFPF